jgi:hypothetical protein
MNANYWNRMHSHNMTLMILRVQASAYIRHIRVQKIFNLSFAL